MTEMRLIARARVQGLHRWPTAPDRRAYLRDLHRHLFEVSAEVRLGHPDREVEFHDLADVLAGLLRGAGHPYHPEAADLVTFEARSCETLAFEVAQGLRGRGYDPVRVAVSEDGENDGLWLARRSD